MKIHVYEERYGIVEIDIPEGANPITISERVNRYLTKHQKEPDSGVTITGSEGWFIDAIIAAEDEDRARVGRTEPGPQ
jgi:hypothetical protein